MPTPPRASASAREQVAVGGHRGQQLAVVADVGDGAVLEQRDPVGEQHRRGAVRDHDAGGVGAARAAAPPRRAPRCARRARTAGRRAPGSRGRASTARASASRCRWPPDSDMPCSPIRVSRPHGRSCTNCACATSSASAISSSVASGAAEHEVLPDAHREQRRLLERGRHELRAGSSASRSRTSTPVDRDPAAGHVVEPRAPARSASSCRSRSRRRAPPSRRARPRGRRRAAPARRAASGNANSTPSNRRWPRGALDHAGRRRRWRARCRRSPGSGRPRSSPPAPSRGCSRATRSARPATASG